MSGLIPERVIEDIRLQSDIADVIGSYLPLKRAGSTFKALCPFHREKTPSFNVNPQRQIFHCFGCGKGGDVFRFVMEHEGVDFITAVRILAKRANIPLEFTESGERAHSDKELLFTIHEEVAAFYHRVLTASEAGAEARAYLESRQIHQDTVRDFMIGFAPERRDALTVFARKKSFPLEAMEQAGLLGKTDDGTFYDRFRSRVMFPVWDEAGRIVAFSGRILDPQAHPAKYVNSPETALFRKSRLLYALNRARKNMIDAGRAIVCEGQIDIIRCHQAGFTEAVAPQGTALTEDHALRLKRHVDRVVLVFDGDTAGETAAIRTGRVCLATGLDVAVATLPAGEDPDSFIRQQGADAFRARLDLARPLLDFQVEVLRGRSPERSAAHGQKIAREVMESIRAAGNEVQREHLLQQAARLLNLHVEALRIDLRRAPAAARETPEASSAEVTAVPHPADEVALLELVIANPHLAEIVRSHLPVACLSDPDCRTLMPCALEASQTGDPTLVTRQAAEAGGECQRLAAAVQCAPNRVIGDDFTAESAAQDLVLSIRRKDLERHRQRLQARLAQAKGPEREALDLECKQLSHDLYRLRQGWEAALPILELHQQVSGEAGSTG